METFRFLSFKVYQEAKLLNKDIFLLTKNWRGPYKELADQLQRATLSICLNIAEGSAKSSDKDFRRYLQNSLGSTNEVVACLDIANSMSLLSVGKNSELVEKAKNIAKQLVAFLENFLIVNC